MNMNDSEPLPKWIMRRYAAMWKTFKNNEFTLDEACMAIKEDKKVMLVLLSNLRRKGWLNVNFAEDDARKRIYKLENPEKVVEAMLK